MSAFMNIDVFALSLLAYPSVGLVVVIVLVYCDFYNFMVDVRSLEERWLYSSVAMAVFISFIIMIWPIVLIFMIFGILKKVIL